MGSVHKGLFQGRWLPQLILIRNRHKPNITKPRLPHFERHIVEHVVMPYFREKRTPQHLPEINACTSDQAIVKKSFLDPYYDLLGKEVLEKVSSAKFIGFFHLNTLSDDELFEARVLLKKNGMKYLYHNTTVMERAFIGSDYEPLLQLYKGPTAMALSDKVDLPKLMKISKRMRKLILMAALVGDRLLSMSEMKYYAEVENLDAARVKLVQTLNSASQTLVQQISQHPNTLIQRLNQRVDDLKKNSSAGS